MWVIRRSIVDWDCSWAQTLLATLKILQQPRAESLCIFGSRTFVPTSWMCKKQTSVSHRSTDSEVISLDAGLRMDGIPAVGLWDLAIVLDFFWKKKFQHRETDRAMKSKQTPTPTPKRRHTAKREVEELSKVDHVVTSAKPSLFQAQLHIFEDNDAMIKMIIKVRSPTMRHVPRNHRVSLDWLFDRINLDQQNQNQICGHQKDNTCWRKAISPVMRGIIFSCFWLTSWNFRCSLAAIPIQFYKTQNHVKEVDARKKTWRIETCDGKNRSRRWVWYRRG